MTETDVRRAAMDLLARREHSRAELARKLRQRFEKQRARLDRRRAAKRLLEPWADRGNAVAEQNVATQDGDSTSAGAHGPVSTTLIEAALEQLENEGLLSDLRFAEVFVRSRIARGQGPVRLRHDMREKGLEAEMIDAALEAAEVDWGEHAKEVLERRFGDDAPDAREKARRMRFLKQRGFSFDACHKLLN